jgi:hypothetical protein
MQTQQKYQKTSTLTHFNSTQLVAFDYFRQSNHAHLNIKI